MTALRLNSQTTVVRPVTETDTRNILKLLENSWRVHIRMAWNSLRRKLKTMPGVLAEDQVGVRGFMMVEAQPPGVAVIVAAGLRDTWGVRPFLGAILPKIEQIAQEQNLSALAYIGYENWLIEELQAYGFEAREWIVTFERFGNRFPPSISTPAHLRMAHRDDLPALLSLDELAFDHLWRKSVGYFSEALAYAGSFVVAEMAGQVVGYEWCEVHHQRAHLTRLAVHPYYQGQGIGSQLLRQAITDVLAQGVNFITLNTQENNQRSRALYTRFGFVNTQQRVPVLWKILP